MTTIVKISRPMYILLIAILGAAEVTLLPNLTPPKMMYLGTFFGAVLAAVIAYLTTEEQATPA